MFITANILNVSPPKRNVRIPIRRNLENEDRCTINIARLTALKQSHYAFNVYDDPERSSERN